MASKLFEAMRIAELKILLAKHNLPTKGKKAELIAR